jgi:hypothetical protein
MRRPSRNRANLGVTVAELTLMARICAMICSIVLAMPVARLTRAIFRHPTTTYRIPRIRLMDYPMVVPLIKPT